MICDVNEFKNSKRSELVTLECDFCRNVFKRLKNICYQNIYKKGILRFDSKCFCTKECKKSYNKNTYKQKRSLYICNHCNVSFESLKSVSPKFCSQSCSAIHNNESRKPRTQKNVQCVCCKADFEIPNWIKRKHYKCFSCIQEHKRRSVNKEKIPKTKQCKECKTLFEKSSFVTYCSKGCKQLSIKPHKLTCRYCYAYYRASKSNSKFCSGSCRSKCLNLHTYAHKKSGLSRSKIELYIEKKLREDYPKLEIKFNDKQTILSEIDIYFPSLKMGVELNGIFHYFPIYGQEVLNRTRRRDKEKVIKCQEKGIVLNTIDLGNCGFTKAYANNIYKKVTTYIEEKMIK